MTNTNTNCDHGRQVLLGDSGEWVCEDCSALMDTDNPDLRVA